MSIVNAQGVQVKPAKQRKAIDTELAKDMAVIGYRAQGLTWKQIGDIMGVTRMAVCKRWHNIPEAARKHYAGQAMG